MSRPTAELLNDDARAIAWLVALLASTPDLYLRRDRAIEPSTSLRDELGIDSIGLVSAFYAILDALGVDRDEAIVAEWRTVADVLAFCRSCVEETGG